MTLHHERNVPFNCQHCAGAVIRNGQPKLRCPQCGSQIYVPGSDGRIRTMRLGGLSRRVCAQNFPTRWGRYPFPVDSWYDPIASQFREEFAFDNVRRGAADEFGAQVRLRHLLREEWFATRPKSSFLKKYGFWSANRLNDHWFCTHMSRMFTMAAAAVGMQARTINVARRATGKQYCHGHMVNDIWSNQHQKWVYMDPLFDFHYEDRHGTPLSLLEARTLYFRKAMRGLYFVTQRNRKGTSPGRYHLGTTRPDDQVRSHQEHSGNLFWCLYYHGQNYFSQPAEERRVRILRYDDDLTAGQRLISKGVELYTNEPMVLSTGSRLDIEPTLNNTEIQLYAMSHGAAADGVLRGYVSTHAPNLKSIRYRLDGGRWRRYGPDGFVLRVADQGCRLEAQTVNQAGQGGRVSVIEILPL